MSTLLIAVSTAFYGLSYQALIDQFRAQRDEEVESYSRQIQALFSGTSDRLIRLGGALASDPDLGEALRLGDRNRVSAAVSAPVFASVGYELELRRIALYSPRAELIWQWSQGEADDLLPARLSAAVGKVRAEEQPVKLLACHPLCLLHAFVPILADGENVGVLTLAQSIADFVIDFRAVTGSDIGIIVPDSLGSGTALRRWEMRVPALTDATRLTPFLELVSTLYPDPTALDGGQLVAWGEGRFEVHRLALHRVIRSQDGFVLLISDVGARLKEIAASARRGLLATVTTLLVAELFLLSLVRLLVRRLRWVAQALPLLAKGRYGEARGRLAAHSRSASFRDEIDILFETAETLSHQLEEASAALNAKNRELAEERDLMQGILDAAQVLVVTQTRHGIIQMANEYAAQLTGVPGAQLRGQRFLDLIGDVAGHRDVLNNLEALYAKGQRRIEHEHDLVRADGTRRQVMWVHTRLHGDHADHAAVVSVGLDVTERAKAESRMRWLANHDTLTGLVNRHRFLEDIKRTFDEVTRTGSTAALLLFDLDRFKEVNDTSGHATGDALLCMIAEELKGRARRSDVIARLGGDEFAVLMPNTEAAGAESFARQLNERLAEVPFVHGGRQYRVGVSIGIALLPSDGADVAEILANADLAMYEAKRAGRGRARLFSGSPPPGEGGISRDYI